MHSRIKDGSLGGTTVTRGRTSGCDPPKTCPCGVGRCPRASFAAREAGFSPQERIPTIPGRVRFLGCCGHQSAEPNFKEVLLGIDVDPPIEQTLFFGLGSAQSGSRRRPDCPQCIEVAHFPGRHQMRSRNQVGSDAGRSTPASFSSPASTFFRLRHGLQAHFFQPWPNAPHHYH